MLDFVDPRGAGRVPARPRSRSTVVVDVTELHVSQHVEAKDLEAARGRHAARRARTASSCRWPARARGRTRRGGRGVARDRGGRARGHQEGQDGRGGRRREAREKKKKSLRAPKFSTRARWVRGLDYRRRATMADLRSSSAWAIRARSTRHPPQRRLPGGRGAGAPARRASCAAASAPRRRARTADVLLAMPQTYMNRSGYAARCLVERRQLEPSSRPGGLRRGPPAPRQAAPAPVGQPRRPPRHGVGHREPAQRPRCRACAWAWARRTIPSAGEGAGGLRARTVRRRTEREAVTELVARAADACECWLAEGHQATMNKFND